MPYNEAVKAAARTGHQSRTCDPRGRRSL